MSERVPGFVTLVRPTREECDALAASIDDDGADTAPALMSKRITRKELAAYNDMLSRRDPIREAVIAEYGHEIGIDDPTPLADD